MEIDISKEWEVGGKWFINDGTLPDVIIYGANIEKWKLLFGWLTQNECVYQVNCYDPLKDEIISEIPPNIFELLKIKEFNCHVGVKKGDISIMIHFYLPTTIDCDIDPREFNSSQDYENLITILQEINSVTNTKGFEMNPDGSPEFVFNVNGHFVKTVYEYAKWLPH